MKRTDISKELLLLLLLLLPMIYLGIMWPHMPAVIPTNFNAAGIPERIGDKSDFLLLMIFLFLTNLLLYFLFRYIPHMEEGAVTPEDAAMYRKRYYRIRFMIHIFLAVFSGFIIFMVSRGRHFVMERWTFTGVGLLIGVLGIYLKRLEPNYFVGVRTPWTLRSDEVWKETHRMAGNLWMWTGIVTFIAGFFLPLVTGVFLLMFIGVILAALPYIYSYRLYNTDKG